MLWTDYLIGISLIVFVLYITRLNNMWGTSKGTKKAKLDIRLSKKLATKTRRTLTVMRVLRNIEGYVGFSLRPSKEQDYAYKIGRLDLRINVLNRVITPYELSGLFKAIQLGGIFLTVLLFTLSRSPFSFVFLLLLLAPSFFVMYAIGRIQDEDDKIERDFPDLFLVLYSRLLKGAEQRLAPTLQTYLDSLEASSNTLDDISAIKKFVVDFRNNIEIYADDSMAILKMREKYHSVMVINFCNLALQSVRGVDNSDKLLAFKIELSNRRKDMMRIRADKLVAKGNRAVLIVFLILGQFIVLSWYAKLTQAGGLQGLF